MTTITDILSENSPWEALLNETIRLGIEAASESYKNDENKRNGSVAGFKACRGKDLRGLAELLTEARRTAQKAYFDQEDTDGYWYKRCFEAEVEWTCNVMSSLLHMGGCDPKHFLVPPTYRGMMTAGRVAQTVIGGHRENQADPP